MSISLKKIFAGLLLAVFVSGFSSPNADGMNCAKECLDLCAEAAESSNATRVVGITELSSSFVSGVVRTACEYSPAVIGARELYKPLIGWLEAKPARLLSNLFFIFPAVGIFCPEVEIAFNWIGAVPALASCALMLGDGVFVVLAKLGYYKKEWKDRAITQLTNAGQDDAVSWVNSLL